MLQIKWCGIDFGQCLMEPTGLRNYLVIGDIYKELGQPEKIEAAIKRYRQVVEAYGGYSLLKESNRDKIHSYVLEGDAKAMNLFGLKEKEHLSAGAGADETLKFLNDNGVDVNIVAELKKTLGQMEKNIITRFITAKGLRQHFNAIYTPQGKIDLKTGSVDDSYKGKTKQSGQMYVKLAMELKNRDIAPSEMIMVGDKIATDIEPAKAAGITTVQYTGYIDMGPSIADYRISNFHELKQVVEGMEK